VDCFGKFTIDRGKRQVESQTLSYGLPILVSDIPANMEVGLPAERYFRCADVDDLKKKMEVLLEKELSEEERKEIQNLIEEKYNPKLSIKRRASRGKLGQDSRADHCSV